MRTVDSKTKPPSLIARRLLYVRRAFLYIREIVDT